MCFLSFLWATFETRPSFDIDRKDLLCGLGIALLAVALVFVSVPPEWRVLSDEANLISVSRSFVLNHKAENITMGKNYYDLFAALEVGTPTRPLLYPFLVYLVHLVRGFDPSNGYWANALVAVLFFTGLFYWTKRRYTWQIAAAALVAILSAPVVTLAITCAGFDFLAFALCLFVFALFLRMQKDPNAENLLLLSASVLMLAHVRYESILVFPIVTFFLLIFGNLKTAFLWRYKYFYALIPFLLSPIGLQRYLTQGQYENPTGGPPLAAEYFFKYFGRFIESQMDITYRYPYPTIYLWLCYLFGFFSLILLATKKFKLPKEHQKAFLVISISFLALNTIYLAHHFGDAMHPSQSRFFLLWVGTWTLMPIFSWPVIEKWLRPSHLIGISLASFILYHPFAAENTFMKSLTLPRQQRWLSEFLQKYPNKRVLVVYERPVQMIASGYGAVDASYANNNSNVLLKELKNGLYRDIVVVQRVEIANGNPRHEDSLNEVYVLEKLAEWQTTEFETLRISRVLNK